MNECNLEKRGLFWGGGNGVAVGGGGGGERGIFKKSCALYMKHILANGALMHHDEALNKTVHIVITDSRTVRLVHI